MLTVIEARLNTEIPTVGIELTPEVLIRRPDNNITMNDVPESAPLDNCFLTYKWYRIENDKKVAMCSVHRSFPAEMECEECKEFKIPAANRHHCCPQCYLAAWPLHRALHDRARAAKGTTSASSSSSTNAFPIKRGDETWFEVGRSKTYTPTIDDIGDVLMFQCIVVHAETKQALGDPFSVSTSSPVIPAPDP